MWRPALSACRHLKVSMEGQSPSPRKHSPMLAAGRAVGMGGGLGRRVGCEATGPGGEGGGGALVLEVKLDNIAGGIAW